MQLAEAISLSGLDDIPWGCYEPDEQSEYYSYSYEKTKGTSEIISPSVRLEIIEKMETFKELAIYETPKGGNYRVSSIIIWHEVSKIN